MQDFQIEIIFPILIKYQQSAFPRNGILKLPVLVLGEFGNNQQSANN